MKYFTPERCVEIEKITMLDDFNNNEKGDFIKEYLTKEGIPWSGLGPGTNRIGLLIDGYALKIALDKDGMIDNRREFLYTKALQPYVIKVYECLPNGLLMICEYVEKFSLEDFSMYKEEMKKILKIISGSFLVGDVGITTKNYANWGIRSSTGEIVILDFAYIYNVKYKLFTCSCDGETMVVYDDDYVTMHCPRCGRKYTFGELRKKISRKNQEDEIGDIRRLSYTISKQEEEVDVNLNFEPDNTKFKRKKNRKKTNASKEYEEYLKEARRQAGL